MIAAGGGTRRGIVIQRPIPSRSLSTSYVVSNGIDIVVVDAGPPGAIAPIRASIDQARANGARIAALLVTHAHPDHVGGFAELSAATSAPVFASAHDAERLKAGRSWPKPICKPGLFSRFLYRRIIERGSPHFPPAEVTRTIADGDRLAWLGGIDVVALPGHAMGQLGFRLREHGVFFVGDAMLNVVRPGRMNWHEDADAEVSSLKKIASLDWSTLYVGHGAPVSRPAFERFLHRL